MRVLQPDWPAPAKVRALVTTRSGGVSVGAYAGFNLAEHVGDDARAVAANRASLREVLPAEPLWLNQVHGCRCVDAESATCGETADACVARRAGLVCAVLTADCLPVFFCDRNASVVAVAHAGWRGLAAGVLEATVAATHCRGEELLAWLGPAIGPAVFEVGDEVKAAFIAADAHAQIAFRPHGRNKWLGDLYQLARQRLNACGIASIGGGALCTFTAADRFYSYRRDGKTGRMASLIWIEQ